MTTLLIDGTNLAIIHFTANPSVDSNGVPVGMVKGFLNALSNLNRTLSPDKIMIFFDGKGNSNQRKAIFSEYKEGRKAKQVVGRLYKFSDSDKAEKNKEYQFFILREMIDLLPVTMTVCNNFEADDGISYTAKYRKENNLGHVYIVSCDKDFYQLIDSDVSVYNPMSKKIFGRNEVIEEFGIHPNNWLLYRAIVGDVSDNIDGVKGLGPKTLLKIFSLESDIKFDLEDVETVCDSVEVNSKKPDTLTKNLLKIKENLSKIKRNWELMNLSSPMLTSNSREVLDGAMTESTHFKKLEFWKASTNNCLNLNLPSFDNLRFLTKGKNK